MRSPTTDVTPRFWLGGFGSAPDRYPENILAFAERHDSTIVLSCWNTTPSNVEQLDPEEIAAIESIEREERGYDHDHALR